MADVKDAMGVLYMFIPLPVFWALFDQQVKQLNFHVHLDRQLRYSNFNEMACFSLTQHIVLNVDVIVV